MKKTKEKPNTLTVKFWIYVRNLGDGSTALYFFNKCSEAESFAEQDDERYCDDVYQKTLKVDLDTGKLLDIPIKDE